ncbi:hypothetical protein [Breznakia pachnodae]|uniref:Uncharacterized protein n=1 Tax=Breznakia pachnodae TaxID=265178 RepID=A0ABU0E6J9_9FIRM|nr:hypothetical protein [Breznakia pachnodae]MDQ0362529.1 hypothetical protein [Breznakia pachnodae]
MKTIAQANSKHNHIVVMRVFTISFDRLLEHNVTIIAESEQHAMDIFYKNIEEYISRKPNEEYTTIHNIVVETNSF